MKKLCMILPLAMILCFVVGCQDKEAIAELEEMKAQAEIEARNEAFYRGSIEELNKGNIEILKELFAPDYGFYSPSSSTKSISKEETIEFVKMVFKAFPDFKWSIEELIAVGDKIIVRFIYRGTHEGEFQGIPATGNKVEFSGIVIARIENGKIVEEKEESDALGLMMQLGMELKPKEAEK